MHTIKISIAALVFIITAIFVWPRHHATTATLSVMTFNIENGGTQIDFGKVVEAVKKSNADVVGLQEAWGNTSLLAKELGWKYFNNRQHIVSRYPLLETTDSKNLYTLIQIRPGYVVAMANMHLPDDPYGPDLIKQGVNIKSVEEAERKARLSTALPYIKKLAALAQRGVPVFLTGDFNSPSHLDWQQRTISMPWPITKTIEQHGLVDAYHEMHPNQKITTWPANRPVAVKSFDGFNPSTQDAPDRIDFIFTGGKSNVQTVAIIAEPTYKMANITVTPWPSDHRAVVARFNVTPAPVELFLLKPSSSKSIIHGNPSITVTKHTFKSGEPIVINWHNLVGNRYDYIMIAPLGSKKTAWGEAVRLYTHGEAYGTITYDKATAKGNWLDWHKASEGHWPLKPGIYDIKLMVDDSYTELDKTQIQIK